MSKIYLNKRDNETKAVLDDKYTNDHSVVLEYLTGEKKGKTISVTHSTLKRWWKLIEETTTEEVVEESTMVTDESKLVPMPGAEKLAELKNEVDNNSKKRKKENKPKKQRLSSIDRTTETNAILDALSTSYELSEYTTKGYFAIRVKGEKKCYGEIDITKKHIKIYIKHLVESIPSGVEVKPSTVYGFAYKIDYTENYVNDVLAVLA